MTKFLNSLAGVASIILLVSVPGQYSNALMIGGQVQATGSDSVCFIGFRTPSTGADAKPDEYDVGFCTGTLISPTTVITAAHCVVPLKSSKAGLAVMCGFIPPTAVSSLIQTLKAKVEGQDAQSMPFKEMEKPLSADMNPHYLVTSAVKPAQSKPGQTADESQSQRGDAMSTGDDFAVIHLATPSKLTPTSVMPGNQAAQLITSLTKTKGSPIQCSSSGFGINSENSIGSIRSADMTKILAGVTSSGVIEGANQVEMSDPEDIEVWKSLSQDASSDGMVAKGFYLDRKKDIDASILPGDSGGPLFCRTSSAAPWQLVAVANEMAFGTEAVKNSDSILITELLLWAIPDLSKTTLRVWNAPAATKVTASR